MSGPFSWQVEKFNKNKCCTEQEERHDVYWITDGFVYIGASFPGDTLEIEVASEKGFHLLPMWVTMA